MNDNHIRKNKQLIVDPGKGDCFRACVTSLLGVPNDPLFPNVHDKDWIIKWDKLLYQFGLSLIFDQIACWRSGYWIASVKSKNYKNGTHAIIMNGSHVYFDPSTKKRYKENQSLLGENIVSGGWFFEVIDSSKLYKFVEYQNSFNN